MPTNLLRNAHYSNTTLLTIRIDCGHYLRIDTLRERPPCGSFLPSTSSQAAIAPPRGPICRFAPKAMRFHVFVLPFPHVFVLCSSSLTTAAGGPCACCARQSRPRPVPTPAGPSTCPATTLPPSSSQTTSLSHTPSRPPQESP